MNGSTKKEALKLRLKGHSYNEINLELGIPKSTLSGWFKDTILSKKAQERLSKRIKAGSKHLIKRNKMQTHLARQRARKVQADAFKDIKKFTKRELLLVGTALYWGEGYKRLAIRDGRELTSHPVSFSNSDHEMIKVYILFLTRVLEVGMEDIHARLRIYPHMNENTVREFWIGETPLKESNFLKSSYQVSSASKRVLPYNRLPNGTISIQVNNTEKFHKILGWIKGMKESI